MSMPLDPLQLIADEVIRTWPEVRAKRVFSHLGYIRGGKMFAFMPEGGVSFKAASAADAEALYESGAASPFTPGPGMIMRNWPVVPLERAEQVPEILSAVRDAYESVV